jgi:signal transduction histidine kinase
LLEKEFPGLRFVRLSSETLPKELDSDVKPFLGVPVKYGKEILGVLRVTTSDKVRRDFNDSDQEALEIIGLQIGFAIQSQTATEECLRLEVVAEASRRHLEDFADITRLIAALEPTEVILTRITEAARLAVSADWANLNLVVKEGNALRIAAATGGEWSDPHRATQFPADPAKSASGYVLYHQTYYLVDKLMSFRSIPDKMAVLYHPIFDGINSALIVPVTFGSRRYGVLAVASRRMYAFGEQDDVPRLGRIADQAAVFLEITRLIADLQASAKEKSDYIHTVTHQFTTCLFGIRSHAENLAHLPETTPRRRDIAARSVVSICHILQTLVDNYDLLALLMSEDPRDFDRVRERVSFEKTGLYHWLCNLARDCHALVWGKSMGINVDAESFLGVGEPQVRARIDPKLAYQALWTIVDNALKYGAKGNDVIIRCRGRDSKGLILEVANTADDLVVLTSDLVDKVFLRGFRAPSAQRKIPGGTGLGLWLAKRVFEELHEGRVWAEPTDDQGITRICIQLPLP